MTQGEAGATGRPTLADKINRLFEVMHPRGRGPLSNEEVAAAVNAGGGPTISASYLWLLRTGKRDNPTAHHLEALARHFGVTPAYFFDDEVASSIERELDLLAAMRDAGVKHLALRASGLTPEVLAAISVMVEQARKAQGLPDHNPAAAADATSGSPRRSKRANPEDGER
jgi:transcriptional regulator with XRE-family HTH domain